jgi:ubiquinone/menaquinone biosynthesis C-methylase UbiE
VRREKQIVQEFYDNFGWDRGDDGFYRDTSTFVDLRPVLDDYYRKTHRLVKSFIPAHGQYFLDAGCGAIANAEDLQYSLGYRWRVCVDFSKRALWEARSRLGAEGFFVLADITKLPFKDNVFDGTVSAHVLYHVPEDEQEAALRELHRTVKRGGSCVIIYTWPICWLTKVATFAQALGSIVMIPTTFWRNLSRATAPQPKNVRESRQSHPPIYYHPHDYQWFDNTLPSEWDFDIRCWRSVDKIFTTTLVPNNFLGRLLMNLIFWFETRFPHLSARIGRYPMVVLRKA